MKKAMHICSFCLMLVMFSCNQRKLLINQPKKYYIDPPVMFMSAIVSFRETNGVWPRSLNELMVVSEENRKAVNNFPYDKADFRVKKKDILIVHFSGYRKDPKFSYAQTTEQIDHRMVEGWVRFHKSKGKFVWEVYY